MENKIRHFEVLNVLNVNEKTEKKSNGSTELTYLSWAWAWTEVKKEFPSANYEILKFGENKLPYVYDDKTGYMVFTIVAIEGIEHEMWLPVMDNSNKAMKDKPYSYKVAQYGWKDKKRVKVGEIDKTVDPATMFDINKTIMRCLTKNLAMFGLGLYIYAGEDLPENVVDIDEPTVPKKTKNEELIIETGTSNKINNQESPKALESQLEKIKEIYTQEELKPLLKFIKKNDLEELNVVEASSLIKRKGEME